MRCELIQLVVARDGTSVGTRVVVLSFIPRAGEYHDFQNSRGEYAVLVIKVMVVGDHLALTLLPDCVEWDRGLAYAKEWYGPGWTWTDIPGVAS